MAWKRASMAAALGYWPDGTKARLCFHVQPDSYDTDSLIGVLEQLAGFYRGQRVVLLWDGLSSHWSYKEASCMMVAGLARSPAAGWWSPRVRGWSWLLLALIRSVGSRSWATAAAWEIPDAREARRGGSQISGSDAAGGCPYHRRMNRDRLRRTRREIAGLAQAGLDWVGLAQATSEVLAGIVPFDGAAGTRWTRARCCSPAASTRTSAARAPERPSTS